MVNKIQMLDDIITFYLILSYLILSHLILSHLIACHPILCYVILSYLSRTNLQDSRSFLGDLPHLTLNHGFPVSYLI